VLGGGSLLEGLVSFRVVVMGFEVSCFPVECSCFPVGVGKKSGLNRTGRTKQDLS